MLRYIFLFSKAVSHLKMFLKISQNSQENRFFCEFCETFESIFFYRTRLVAPSVRKHSDILLKCSNLGCLNGRSSQWRSSVKKELVLRISQNLQENTCARVSLLIKSLAWDFQLYEKETPAKVFSCEFCEIFKNIYSEEHLCWLLLNEFWIHVLVAFSVLKF